MNKFFALFLSALFIFQIQFVSFAEDLNDNSETEIYEEVLPSEKLSAYGNCGDNLTWYLWDNGVLTIDGTGEMDSWPAPYNPDWYFLRNTVTMIYINDGVSSIGAWAFNDFSALEEIIIPQSVTKIGDGAISACTSLKSLVIPNNVTSIGKSVFRGNEKMESVSLSDNILAIPEQAFYGCNSLKSVNTSKSLTSIGVDAFNGCSSLETFDIKPTVTTIGKRAFYGCSSLKSAVIPLGVKTINDATFYECSSLKSISLSENLTSIGETSFYNCSSLASVSLPNTLTTIGKSAFEGCSLIKSITIPSKMTTISESTFSGCTNLSEVNIPNNITSLGAYAFRNCSSLEEIYLSDKITSMAKGAFMGCTALYNVNLPKNLKTLASSCFSGCISLTQIEIPATITSIGENIFANCSKLTDVKFEDGFKKMYRSMFFGCTSLNTVVIPSSVNYIGSNCFEGCTSLQTTINLSTDAVCYNDIFTNCKNNIIYCYAGSSTEEYAKTNKLDYVLIDDILVNVEISKVEEGYNISAESQNIIGDTQYKFYYIYDGMETLIQDYSDNSTCFFDPPKPGCYEIFTEVTDLRNISSSGSNTLFVDAEDDADKIGIFVFKVNNTNIYHVDSEKKISYGAMTTYSPNGKVLVSVRAISAAVGISDLKYDEATSKITFTGYEGYNIEMTVGSTNVKISKDDDIRILSTTAPVTIINGATMLPIRDVSALVGGSVKYIDGGYVITSSDSIDETKIEGYIQDYETK